MTFPRHVLMTTDTVGGVWTYSIELAGALSRQGVKVSLATMGTLLSPSQRADVSGVRGLDVYESQYKLEWMENGWKDVAESGSWLLSLSDKLRPDIVHLNTYAHGVLDWQAPAVVACHSCVLSWFDAVRQLPAPAQWDEYRRRAYEGLRGSAAVVAVSQFMAAEIDRWYGPLPQITTIYNCRQQGAYVPARKQEFVLCCGRLWDEGKNVGALDRASESLLWPVFVAGEDKHPDGGRPRLNRIRPMGQLPAPELADWFSRAAIYALPARYEPFGLSVLEAALSGCALVLGDIPSFREIWHDAAMFVPPDDDEALAIAINALARNTALREKLSGRARDRALAFTPERMLEGYLDVYGQAQARYKGARTELSCAS
jgi:glycogen synthase